MTYSAYQTRKIVVKKEEMVKPELYTSRHAGRKCFSCVKNNKYFNGSGRYGYRGIDAGGKTKKGRWRTMSQLAEMESPIRKVYTQARSPSESPDTDTIGVSSGASEAEGSVSPPNQAQESLC